MEIPGAGYLYTLAVISITFVGFTALLAILRQTAGGALTTLDVFLIRTFIQLGLMATGGAMLAPLFALSGLTPDTVWSVSSAIVAVVLGCWAVTFPKRRLAASPIKVPNRIWALFGLLPVGVIALAVNAVKPISGLRVIFYAAPIAAILFVAAMMLLASLFFLISRASDVKLSGPKS